MFNDKLVVATKIENDRCIAIECKPNAKLKSDRTGCQCKEPGYQLDNAKANCIIVPKAPAEKPAEEAGATIKAAPASAIKPAAPVVPDEPVKPAIASDDETYDDFSEFFDDNK